MRKQWVMIELYPPMYQWLKPIHVGCVLLSFSLFFIRGVWMIRENALLQQRWVKIVPHVIDSLLLVSAIALSIILAQYPFVHGWLTTKVVLLVLYIGLGMVALKRGRTKKVRVIAWIGALLVFSYIVLVAYSKQVFLP